MSDFSDQDKEWLRSEFVALRSEMHDLETRLLTAFHGWASPVEMRLRNQRDEIHTLQVTIDALTDRLTKLERPPS